ncbi:MAG: cytochrome c3 family protein [Ignavibacteriales bacterium]|nr:cytochrome c3 family protein [Ignavibacteriales bacterium]
MRKRTDVSKPDLKGAYHRQCMECHRTWSGKVDCESCHALNGGSQNTKTQILQDRSAKRVHPKIIAPTTLKFDTPKATGKMVTFYHSQHADLFGLECQSCHTNESCAKCHTKNKTSLLKTKTTEQKHAVCSSCHNTKQNCGNCHSHSVQEGFNHATKTGFDITKFHGKVSCNTCHTEKGKFTGLNSECINCHGKWTQENFQHKVTGVILDETHLTLECKDCHQEKNYSKPICSNCHEDKSFPKNIPGKLIKKNG